jgi:hypothetical protein
MSYNTNNLAIHKFTSKSSIRPEFQCVAFYGDRTIATDTFRLVEVSAHGKEHPPILHRADDVKNRKVKKGEAVEREALQLYPVEAQYPEVDIVLKREFENGNEYTQFTVNGEYLAEIAKMASTLSKHKKITLAVPRDGGTSALRIVAVGDMAGNEGQRVRAIVMPMKA